MKRPKLVIFCNDYGYFLAHRYQLFSHLPEKGYTVVAYCGGQFPAEPRDDLAFPIRRYACDRFRFRPLMDVLLFWQMLTALGRERPDVVHTITLKPNLFGGLAMRLSGIVRRKAPRLVMVSPGLGRVFSETQKTAAHHLVRATIVRCLRLALSHRDSAAFFENAEDRDRWVDERIVPRERAQVVAGTGVDPSIFRPVCDRPLPPPLRVLFAGRMLKAKGADAFVEIARRFQGKEAEVAFLAAGSLDRKDKDAFDIASLALPQNLTCLGNVADMPSLLKSVHVVCLPTTYAEGLPRILLEGAAMGLALMATDVPGCRRAVIDGRTGYLVPVSHGAVDIACAVERIEALARNRTLARDMGAAALSHFQEGGFALASVRDEIEAILFSRP